MKKPLATLAAALLLAGNTLAAEVRATPQDAEDLVKTAVSFIKKQGADKAYKEFQSKAGPFIYKDLYVMVYDLNGKCLAHGADPSKVGKDLMDQKDVDGKLYTRERVELAKAKGSGWQEYRYKNPANGKVEPKVVYFERVGDTVVSAGAYKP